MNDRAPAVTAPDAPESPAAIKRRRFFVPEVIQTSAMDCGPAALKCLLAGYGVNASYGRLREACQTSIDGTSIDTLEALAGQLGLEAEQITLPVENLLLPEAAALPALVVVVLPSGLTHFLVVWRRHGPWVQVMDPARGRRWMRCEQLLREVYRHENRIPADDFRAWAESDGFRDPLVTRLRRLGVGRARALVDEALAAPGWQGVAALDAATRATEALVDRDALPRGRAPAALRALHAAAGEGPGASPLVGDGFWMAKPAPAPAPPAAAPEEGETLIVRGAILVRVVGKRAAPAAADAPTAVPAEVAAVIEAREQGPGQKLVELLRADGLWRWPPLLAGLALASLGAVFEALLFRGFLDVGRRLQLVEQRLFAVVAMVALLVGLFCIEWPLARGLWGIGRRLEVRLRRAFLEKIPRLEDRYFQSRPVSDMAERAHLVHWLRLFPGQGGQLVRAMAEMTATIGGIVWLHPPSAPIAVLLAVAMVGTPLLFQPALVERDLRMRSHAGGLARFYLDALLGLTAIRAHTAEAATTREHAARLWEWARAAWDSARTTVSAEAVQLLLGFALAGWLLFDYLVSAAGSGWALLLVYWALALPVLGQEIGFLIQQYPRHRNVTLRLVEPLGAPESTPTARPPAARAGGGGGGAEIHIDGVAVRLAGHEILGIDSLRIAAGSQVAIVGASGSGKTSLVGLLLGWHEPSEGRVLVDGQALDAGALARLRRETVWVEPGVYLWNRSLLENLRYGAGEDRAGAVGAAIEEAELDELLGRLPVGLQTNLGEGGALLSGGEGQRVRFGRGVMRGPARLVVLDEAFRGLERPRRRAMLERARARWAGATLLCVTHDVAHTLGFERVLVVAGGRIAEDGAPAALAAQPGSRFRALLEAERRVQARLRGGEWRQLVVDAGGVRAPADAGAGAPAGEESPA